jgi:hypothetical protein
MVNGIVSLGSPSKLNNAGGAGSYSCLAYDAQHPVNHRYVHWFAKSAARR